jgi:hypothetical protein
MDSQGYFRLINITLRLLALSFDVPRGRCLVLPLIELHLLTRDRIGCGLLWWYRGLAFRCCGIDVDWVVRLILQWRASQLAESSHFGARDLITRLISKHSVSALTRTRVASWLCRTTHVEKRAQRQRYLPLPEAGDEVSASSLSVRSTSPRYHLRSTSIFRGGLTFGGHDKCVELLAISVLDVILKVYGERYVRMICCHTGLKGISKLQGSYGLLLDKRFDETEPSQTPSFSRPCRSRL